MAKKKNWNILRKQKVKDTVKYRDVYEDQQLERGHIKDKQKMTSRTILAALVGIFAAVLTWVFTSFVYSAIHQNDVELPSDPSKLYFFVEEHYEANEDGTEPAHITKVEYAQLENFYNNRGKMAEVKEPVKPKDPELERYEEDTSRNGYIIPGYPNSFMSKSEYDSRVKKYEADLNEYKKRLERYESYKKSTANPADLYHRVYPHYRRRDNVDEYITSDTYDELVAKYEKKVSKGKIDADDMDVPAPVIYPKSVWYVDTYGGEDGKQPLIYRNRLDGSTISYQEFDRLFAEASKEHTNYDRAYQMHKQRYHAGEGGISLAPNDMNVKASLFVGFLVFAVLLAVLKKNLDAQNIMSDTSDINQYHNDQHVALPEEVQKNYDWFPDVGAHSAVQVSSMISHMALQNKGLKTVELATRAEKDIVDKEGNVEYYKGEILTDDAGEPIVTVKPMIDEKFMEALFDASGAPNDKEIRVRYDATKIPYNPDGSNRDKLGTYNTVADLINADWEFPVYEPQRPAGAYVVDTAPVNTMILAITRAGKGQTVIEKLSDSVHLYEMNANIFYC